MKTEIAAQAKAIMDEFMSELAKVRLEEEFGLEREAAVRPPAPKAGDPEFRRCLLKNAPAVKDDCVLAEKKSW